MKRCEKQKDRAALCACQPVSSPRELLRPSIGLAFNECPAARSPVAALETDGQAAASNHPQLKQKPQGKHKCAELNNAER
jgi:hypothetical protein